LPQTLQRRRSPSMAFGCGSRWHIPLRFHRATI
jgi:hypothetical protein